jgi:hypothetical protein
MAVPFDPTPYFHLPRLDTAGSIGLANGLGAAAPKKLSAGTKAVLKAVKTSQGAVQKAWNTNRKPASGKAADPRAADHGVDLSWAGMNERLGAFRRLSPQRYPRAGKASKLVEALFPNGMGFLRLPYPQEWAESERLLNLIDEDKLAPALNDLCGPEFLIEIRRSHLAYGEALGITSEKAADPELVKMNGPLLDLSEVMRRYLIKIIAELDTGKESDLAVLRRALKPIDDMRTGVANRDAAKKTKAKKAQAKKASEQKIA